MSASLQKKVPIYIFAQIFGGFVGAMCIYGLYINPTTMLDPNKTETTASLYTTFPATFLRTPETRITCFYNEVLATAVLLIIVLAIGSVYTVIERLVLVGRSDAASEKIAAPTGATEFPSAGEDAGQ